MKTVFLESRHAAWITHLSVAALAFAYVVLLVRVSFLIAFPLAVFVAHRMGVLLHEYLHGIPFRKYRDNLYVVSLFDGVMLMFGTIEMFRATHLAHHRWLNTAQDPACEIASRPDTKRLKDILSAPELVQYLAYFKDALAGRKPYVRLDRVLLDAALSTITVVTLVLAGHPELVWKMLAINVFTILVPVSLRGAVEHHSRPGDSRFANEYRVWIPLFNINRHIHHHEDPTLPWYRLQFRSSQPLANWNYFTTWYHVYIKRDFVLMQPQKIEFR